MLVIKPFVNYRSIDDEIWIHNTGLETNDIYEYKIRKPEGYEHLVIYHKRTDGWRVLTEKALRILNNG
jgi:hypothetical protein